MLDQMGKSLKGLFAPPPTEKAAVVIPVTTSVVVPTSTANKGDGDGGDVLGCCAVRKGEDDPNAPKVQFSDERAKHRLAGEVGGGLDATDQWRQQTGLDRMGSSGWFGQVKDGNEVMTMLNTANAPAAAANTDWTQAFNPMAKKPSSSSSSKKLVYID